MTGAIPPFIASRRSVRAFAPEPLPREVLDVLVAAACHAPAPHHSRPWRFVVVETAAGKEALARGMGRRWRSDLATDGVAPERIDQLVQASESRLTGAPALVLACLTWEGLDRYPDERRRRAEWGMALLSLGAAVENLLLTAADTGLASCWVAAPIFCPDEARDALDLPTDWSPQALAMVGRADPAYRPPLRLPPDLEALRMWR